MIKISLHVPGFVEVGDDFRRNYEAESWEELQKIEPLSRWAADPKFDHWCLSDNHLMAQMKNSFWVVAYVREGLDQLALPAWIAP